jgi:DNA mismatch endonuclease Vsr
MKGNRGKDTKPELLLRRLLREAGYPGYRLHWEGAPGRPDIAYPGRKIAIFVNGCFWHRCPHCRPSFPKSHPEYWNAKFAANRERDARKVAQLEAAGWAVITVWECEIRDDPARVATTVTAVLGRTSSGTP